MIKMGRLAKDMTKQFIEGDDLPDDEDTGRRVTHYDPAAELIAQRAELARLRDVEQLAQEMAARLIGLSLRGNPKGVAYCALCMEDWNSPHADDCPIARARALGLLEQ